MAKPKRGRSTAAIDDHVGARIRERRIMLGLTQQQLAEMIGVTYQQAHKYERGINRVSAGRLYEIARVLNAPITYFYEGLGQEQPRPATPHKRMLREIARNFAEIQNEKHQEAVSQLARALAGRGSARAGRAERAKEKRVTRKRAVGAVIAPAALAHSGAEIRIEPFGEPQQGRPLTLAAEPRRVAERRELRRLTLASLGRGHDDLGAGGGGRLDLQLSLGRALEVIGQRERLGDVAAGRQQSMVAQD